MCSSEVIACRLGLRVPRVRVAARQRRGLAPQLEAGGRSEVLPLPRVPGQA